MNKMNQFWSLGKTFKKSGMKYRDLINESGNVFMTLKAKNALWVVDGYNARLRNKIEREELERQEAERETLAYGEAVMTAMDVW
jgi:hypothetical protein